MHDPIDAEADQAGITSRLEMDVRGALLERVLQQPVDDVHDMPVINAEIAGLAELDELFEIEQGRVVALFSLCIPGALD